MSERKRKNVKPFKHDAKCRLWIAANCAIGIECKHGHDVCPRCDPCTCKTGAK